MQHHGPLRLFRSLVFTGTIVGLAAGGHVIGGGTLPAPIITLALTALLMVPVTWLSKRELSFPVLLGLLGAGQMLLHEALSTLSVSAVCQAPATGRGSHHAATSSLHCLPASPAELNAHSGPGIDPLAMLSGHALAVLATAWLLRQGEAALWQLLAWLRPLAVLPRAAVVPVAGPRTFAHDPILIPAPWRNLRRHSLRGPPAAALLRAAFC
ncbi:hypothetical protein ACIP9X_08130 [Arthrobacter sp. NPDC093125]|uniref:hypothetical protein n=1 Tax=Arthrobacter sp. NPDC093125 TaxID=3363944 RepID=UPI003825AE2C